MRLSSSGKWLIAAATLAAVAAVVAWGGVYALTRRAPSSVMASHPAAVKSHARPETLPQELSVPSGLLTSADAELVTSSPTPATPAEPARIQPEFQVGRQLPVGWTMQRSESRQPRETTICFEVPGHPGVVPSVLYHPFSEPTVLWSSDLRAWLSETAEAKAAQRVREGHVNYQNRSQMLPRIIGNRPALSWSAEFTRDGEPWVENLTRLFSPAGTALFFLKAPAREIEEVQSLFDIVIESTVMPSLVKTTEVASAR